MKSNKKILRLLAVFLIFAILLPSCGGGEVNEAESDTTATVDQMYFEEVSSDHSGITFLNTITETDSFNFFNYEYIYNGGGVAVGDINNDGLEDLYFTGNQVEDKLYLNKGDLKFEDITSSAIGELASVGWHTGVTMADVNGDGYLDIYVSRSGNPTDRSLLSNLLFINNGDLTFSEKGAEYGVDIPRTTTQSLFFDADNDGDLDLYIMNHPYNRQNLKLPALRMDEVERLKREGSDFSDVFLRNDNGKYVDATIESGITNYGFGLGVASADFNNDGYVDLYVSNDYMEPDYLYMNNGDGTFSEEVKERTKHISNYSMGNDAADFNNDGFIDFLTTDMASEDHIRSKKNMGAMSTTKFWETVRSGLHFQYMFNTLQLNNGDGTFTDIGQMAGVSKTDWSWAPLFADFDNDGYKDLIITNGYRRDTRDNDFNNSIESGKVKPQTFNDALELMPSTKIQNYYFKNTGDFRFTKVNEIWKTETEVNTNGAVYADLDNDGDLDLVMNNMEDIATILENKLQTKNDYIKIQLKGDKNLNGQGVKVAVYCGDKTLVQEVQNTKGYQSSVSPTLHFGVGNVDQLDSIKVFWNSTKMTSIQDVKVNQIITMNESDALKITEINVLPEKAVIFKSTGELGVKHEEIVVNDFEREVLLPHKMSQLGPFASKGDVNGDGREDFYMSGSRGFSGKMMLQTENGEFSELSGPWSEEKAREELGSELIDVDNDGDLDLYVVSGSNEYKYDSHLLMDQLYINNGEKGFSNETAQRLPEMVTSGQRIASGDFDNDGDIDLFVGGRQTPGFYPFAPRSYLLENNNGYYEDITQKSADLMGPGMITGSVFSDFDRDGDLDLVCVGEWMPVSFYENRENSYMDVTNKYNPDKEVGWFMSISVADLNGDGKDDYVIGNIGENNKFHPSKKKPLEIYCHDFDENGSYDIVLGKYQNGVCYPVRGRQCSSEQMPFITSKFPTYTDFAIADLEGIYGEEALEEALHYSATDFQSQIFLSSEKGYSIEQLPSRTQFGPVNATILADVNSDGNIDIIGAGNNYGAEVETIRYDGGVGFVLLNNGKGGFDDVPFNESGLLFNTDVKDLIIIENKIISFSNNSNVLGFQF